MLSSTGQPGGVHTSAGSSATVVLRGTARLQRRRVWRRRCTTVVTWQGRPPGRLRRGAGMQGMVVVAAAEEEAAAGAVHVRYTFLFW